MEKDCPHNDTDVAYEKPGFHTTIREALPEGFLIGQEKQIFVKPLLSVDEVKSCNRYDLQVYQGNVGWELQLIKHWEVETDLLEVNEAPK